MDDLFVYSVHESLQELFDLYGFKVSVEYNEGADYLVEIESEKLGIRIQKYHRELYSFVYKIGDKENKESLFNLLEFLKLSTGPFSGMNFFSKEKDTIACYKNQLAYIVETICENYSLLFDFFYSENYPETKASFDIYWNSRVDEMFSVKKSRK